MTYRSTHTIGDVTEYVDMVPDCTRGQWAKAALRMHALGATDLYRALGMDRQFASVAAFVARQERAEVAG